MIRAVRLCVAALMVGVVAGGALADTDPVAVLKQIQDARVARYRESVSKKTTYDAAAAAKESVTAAEKAVAGVDPKKVPADKAYDWARLFAEAERQKDVVVLMDRYLASNPPAATRFQAEILRFRALAKTDGGKKLATELPAIKPANADDGQTLLGYTLQQFAQPMVKAVGTDNAFKVIDLVAANVPSEDPAVGAKRILAQLKASGGNYPDEKKTLASFENYLRSRNESMPVSVVTTKADILLEQGKTDKAVALLNGFVKAAPNPNSAAVSSVKSKVKLLTLVGTPVPALKVEETIGDFPGADKLKGRVVVLDFFAFWCGPCRNAFPDTAKMLADLHGKGLDVYGVTWFQGFYGKDNTEKRDMARPVELGHMKDFVAEQKMTWPVVFVPQAQLADFGVNGIPHIVLIDRKGNVRKIDVGYSPESFKQFRAEVEKLL